MPITSICQDAMKEQLLKIRDLNVGFRSGGILTEVVRGISLDVNRGERVALVGESGCGKSMTVLSVTRLPPVDSAEVRGDVSFNGKPVAGPGRGISYVFQDPLSSLNPVMRIGSQMAEALPPEWRARSRSERERHLCGLLERVDLPSPGALLKAYPCELSGGMCQRVMIAAALAAEPELLIADEPTTALDVTTQADVMDLICSISRERGMALLLSTHNLGLVRGRCDRVYVLYAGQVVETGAVADVMSSPRHPYTRGLIAAVPKIDEGRANQFRDIPGIVPSPDEIRLMRGCAFRPRCSFASEGCSADIPLQNGVRCVRI